MKQETYELFKIGEFVFWSRQRDGLYVIKEVLPRGRALPPLLLLERVYNTNYDKCTGNRKDREYQVDASFCKIVSLKDILDFEERKLERVKKMIANLKNFKV